MSVPTTTVTIDVLDPGGVAVVGATITALLSDYDVYQDQIVPREAKTATTDAQGHATIALFPNVSGERDTAYRFTIKHPTTGRTIYQTLASVPVTACTLTDIAGNV